MNGFYQPYWNSDELEHHGILGQEWGKRNGPPYPLDKSDKSFKEKRLEKFNSKKSENLKDIKSKRHINKKAIAIGAAITIGVVAAYGIHKTGVLKNISLSNASDILDKIGDNTFGSISDFKKKPGEVKNTIKDIAKDAKIINPLGGKNNCVACSVAYDLRRRGLDVIANTAQNDNSRFDFATRIDLWYKNPKVDALYEVGSSKDMYTALCDSLIKQGDGARGIVCGFFKRVSPTEREGHAISYQVLGDKLYFIDGQLGKILDNPYQTMFAALNIDKPLLSTRLDNLEVDWDYVKELVSNR